MDHLREFGLSRDPFGNDPLPGLYYESPVHRGAERRLTRGIAQHRGLCVLTGEPGAGKSFLARRLLENLEEEVYEANLLLIVNSGLDAAWLLSRVAAGLGVEEPAADPLALLGQAYDRLAAFHEEGRRPVLFIDDAHVLDTREHMEALRALVDLEYEDRHLLTLVLVGRPSLDRILALDPCLPDRVEVRAALEALDVPTATAYLSHRIHGAGGHPSLLEPDAVEAIQRWAQGLPRRMNVVADNALFEAHLAERTRVTAEDVERAARVLRLESVPVSSLADSLQHAGGGEVPGGEPIDLTQEISGARAGGGARGGDEGPDLDGLEFGDAGSWHEPGARSASAARSEEKDEPEEAALFAPDDAAEAVVVGGSEEGVDRDVDDLFERLVDD